MNTMIFPDNQVVQYPLHPMTHEEIDNMMVEWIKYIDYSPKFTTFTYFSQLPSDIHRYIMMQDPMCLRQLSMTCRKLNQISKEKNVRETANLHPISSEEMYLAIGPAMEKMEHLYLMKPLTNPVSMDFKYTYIFKNGNGYEMYLREPTDDNEVDHNVESPSLAYLLNYSIKLGITEPGIPFLAQILANRKCTSPMEIAISRFYKNIAKLQHHDRSSLLFFRPLREYLYFTMRDLIEDELSEKISSVVPHGPLRSWEAVTYLETAAIPMVEAAIHEHFVQ